MLSHKLVFTINGLQCYIQSVYNHLIYLIKYDLNSGVDILSLNLFSRLEIVKDADIFMKGTSLSIKPSCFTIVSTTTTTTKCLLLQIKQ